MTCLLLFTALVTPFEIAFLEAPPPWTTGNTVLFVINKCVDFMFIIDLGMNFFVAFFSDEESKWIYEPSKIRRRYLRSWFGIDFVSILPFDTVGLVIENDDMSFTVPKIDSMRFRKASWAICFSVIVFVTMCWGASAAAGG